MARLYNASAARDARDSWCARLELKFAQRATTTKLVARNHRGPLQVQRGFYPEADGTCHIYLLHPPGGIVGGDRLDIDVTLAAAARALLTTPAAGKIYRSDVRVAHIAQNLRVASGAILEWFPQETIFYRGARARMHTRVELEAGAGFVGWEIACLGRRAADETFDQGAVRAAFELWRDGAPLFIERAHFRGGDAALSAPWGMDNYSVTGTLLALSDHAELVPLLRAQLPAFARGGGFSVTQADAVLVVRYLGHSAQAARQGFAQAWQHIRALAYKREAHSPRIWAS